MTLMQRPCGHIGHHFCVQTLPQPYETLPLLAYQSMLPHAHTRLTTCALANSTQQRNVCSCPGCHALPPVSPVATGSLSSQQKKSVLSTAALFTASFFTSYDHLLPLATGSVSASQKRFRCSRSSEPSSLGSVITGSICIP